MTGERRQAQNPGNLARAERLRASLRENLKRRKAQAKGRSLAGASHDSAGIVQEIVTDKPKR